MSNENPALKGACLCGAVTFQSTSFPETSANCYCQICAKLHGAPFATCAVVPAASFSSSGDKAEVDVTGKATRYFCAECYSPVFMKYKNRDEIEVMMAAIDEASCIDPLPKPSMHIFVKEKVGWYDITDDMPQHQAFSPGWDKSQ